MLNRLKRSNLQKGLGRQKSLEHFMVSFHIQGLMDIVDVSFDKGFPVKVTQM